MKLTILKEKLIEGLKIVERIVEKSLTLPILNNVLISTEKNFFNLKATNLEIGINWWTLAKVEKEGTIVIPVHLLSSFINLLPETQITLEKKDLFLEISCLNFLTKIKCFSPEDFPIIPKIQETETISIDINSFCQGLEQIVNFSSPSTTRPEISGIYFAFQKDLLIMAATDSFRLGEKKIFFQPSLIKKEHSFILPQKTARELINIFGEEKGQFKIYFSPNQIMFESLMVETPHPRIQIVSRLIEGEYPNYQEIIPKKYETQVILPKNEFLNQIKLASLFSGKINEVKFEVNPQKQEVLIFSQSPDLGEHKSSILGEIKGQKVTISFNWRFLVDGLLNIKTPEVVFELNGEDGPAVLKPLDDQSYIYVVMPIKAS